MDGQGELYKGVRPSDLRFDNVHLLAEYIARAQRLVDSASRTQQASEQLLNGAMKTAKDGVRQFRAAGQHLAQQSTKLETALRTSAEQAAGELANGVASAQAAGATLIMQAGEIARARFEGLAERADQVNQAAARLEEAAERADRERQKAEDSLASLNAFKAELQRFERESLARVAEAKDRLYRGVGFWKRLGFAFIPPTPEVRDARVPSRPVPQGGQSAKAQARR